MANMNYCKFENTYKDLYECYNNINEQLSDREHGYRQQLVAMCQSIIDEYDESCQEEDEGPEYDGAGFSEEDRIVNGEYRVIDTQNNNNIK